MGSFPQVPTFKDGFVATFQKLSPDANGLVNWNPVVVPFAEITLIGNVTFNAAVLAAGLTAVLYVRQDAIGSRLITWLKPPFYWPGGTAPTLSTGAAALDIVTFACDGTQMCGVAQTNFS